jgi:hypothetical protein
MDNQIFSRKKAEAPRDGFLENGQPDFQGGRLKRPGMGSLRMDNQIFKEEG